MSPLEKELLPIDETEVFPENDELEIVDLDDLLKELQQD
ncbi:hypothetical protein AM1_A0136 (plasmid) [Acaryochloris marina MBIC11017]|uniref:Uncharacterized protein n=1 Tax=Acaryochloris marina (strain MBIC 11017) TaxID=329726 RepID=A8ZKE5_ACAM1|nr:hypothetical protein AM1_0216 [Acaryochloris marina MBIC11017]ABW31645.1 hypothetical protein AM1_A0136 [Acaryochloris marina MBIC11017]